MAERCMRVIAGLSVALALIAGTTAPAGAQVQEQRRFFVVAGLLCVGPGPAHGVLAGAIDYGQTHGDIFRFCKAGDPAYLQVFEVHGAQSVGGGGGSSSPGATCRTASYVTVCTEPDGVSRVVAIFAVFEHQPPLTVLRQMSELTAVRS